MEKSFFSRYLLCLKKGFSILIIFTIVGILLGLWISSITYKQKYEENTLVELCFRYQNNPDIKLDEITSEENIKRCTKLTKSLETGSSIKTYQYVEITDIDIKKEDNYYILTANKDSFNVSSDGKYSDVAAKGFLKHLTILPLITDDEIKEYTDSDVKGHQVFDYFDKDFYKEKSLDDEGKIHILVANENAAILNKVHKTRWFTIWISSGGLLFLIASLVLVFYFVDKLDLEIKHEYDNINIYRTPFHIRFFNQSVKAFKDVKSICVMAILLSFVLIVKLLPIPSGFGNLGITFGFIFLSVACMLYGPYPALVLGALSDIIGYLIKPDGMFFIGYTIQSMLACFTYALCFHKTHITYSRCLLARVIVNFLCNVIIGGISWGIISGFTVEATISYMMLVYLPKNLVYLLPQSLIIYFVIKALAKPMEAAGVLNEDIANNISFF